MELDIFEEVSPKDIDILLQICKERLDTYYPFCQYVKIMETYKKQGVKIPEQTVYRYGSIEEGVYLFEAHFNLGDTYYTIYHIFTASMDYALMEEALFKTERIPWSASNFVFQATLKRFSAIVRKVAVEKGVKLKGVEEDLLWLPPDRALIQARKVPDGLELKFLDASHADLMNSQWKFKFTGSSRYLAIQIRNNFGLGLFRKSDAKLLCSAVTYNSGGIFCLFTELESRGKGYAEIIIRGLVKELQLKHRVPFATVHAENIPSQIVFKKVGFEVFSAMEFITPPNF